MKTFAGIDASAVITAGDSMDREGKVASVAWEASLTSSLGLSGEVTGRRRPRLN